MAEPPLRPSGLQESGPKGRPLIFGRRGVAPDVREDALRHADLSPEVLEPRSEAPGAPHRERGSPLGAPARIWSAALRSRAGPRCGRTRVGGRSLVVGPSAAAPRG